MKTLADEILDALPAMIANRREGATVEDITAALYVPTLNARAAVKALKADGRALLVRYAGSNRRFLCALDHDFGRGKWPCAWCGLVVKKKRRRRFCCQRCAALAHRANPETESRRVAGIKRSYAEGRVASDGSHMKTEAARKATSEKFKKLWADPAWRAVMMRKIQAARSTPAARAGQREKGLAWRKDPEKVAAANAKLRGRVFSPQHRARISASTKARWSDPEWAATTGAALLAKIHARNKGRANAPEHQDALMLGLQAYYSASREARLANIDLAEVASYYASGISVGAVAFIFGIGRRDAEWLYPCDLVPTCGCGRPSNHFPACWFRRQNTKERLRAERQVGIPFAPERKRAAQEQGGAQ